MEYQTRKRIIIVIVTILILALLIALIYYLSRPSPSCNDGIRNRDEVGIDCGGVYCEPCATRKKIEVVWQKAILVDKDNNIYDLAAQIRNPNPNHGLPQLNYSFVLKNNSGVEVGRKQGTTFILPDGQKYIIEPFVQAKEPVAFVELQLTEPLDSDWQKLKEYQSPQVYVKDKNIAIIDQQSSLAYASGVVQNDTNFDFDTVWADVVIFGDDNEIIGASKTMIKTLMAGEKRAFSIKIPFRGTIGSSSDMQVEVNLFDNDNYMKKFGEPTVQ